MAVAVAVVVVAVDVGVAGAVADVVAGVVAGIVMEVAEVGVVGVGVVVLWTMLGDAGDVDEATAVGSFQTKSYEWENGNVLACAYVDMAAVVAAVVVAAVDIVRVGGVGDAAVEASGVGLGVEAEYVEV